MTSPATRQVLRIAVIGAGAFGRNHLRVYAELAARGAIELVAVVDADANNLAAMATTYALPGFSSVAALLEAFAGKLDAASVCVPTVHHAAVARELLAAGVDVLIEKPFASTLAEADDIIAVAQAQGRIVQIGHLERFNPAVTAVAGLRSRPMFFESHRLSIFTLRSLDVDVVLDLMIHDLDIVLQLAASPVREVRAVGLPVLSRKVDIANVRLEFESGCVANFTASRISTEQVRKLRFFQPHQYLSLDFARQELLTIDVAPEALAAFVAGAPLPAMPAEAHAAQASQHPTAGLSLRRIPTEKAEPLRLEIEAFLRAVATRDVPVVSAQQGRAALALALDINAEIRAHTARAAL